eukprot:NODE_8266_length_1509_cov_7.659913.p1 GENE.NODE_8266_length_1509_cov_7.659913~~NODE_8266_length_1509_cov_7.659913.p1  ORF type:complete len:373 (-),score=111.02 NODE_8266_length_1509_cov_7.659913:269-1387(-)
MSEVRQRRATSQNAAVPAAAVAGAKRRGGSGWLCRCFCGAAIALVVATVVAAVNSRVPAPPVQAADIEAAGNRWVRLGDGRLLEYALCAEGEEPLEPVYFAHPYGQSANFATSATMCAAAAKYGFRVFSVSMPGFGLSDSMPLGFKRSLLDWPTDVQAVLDKEGIGSFGLMGASAGCVHAAAVARTFSSRITSVLLVAPTGPTNAENAEGISGVTGVLKAAIMMPYMGDLLAKYVLAGSIDTRLSAVPDCHAAVNKMQALGGGYGKVADDYVRDMERTTSHTYRGMMDNAHTVIEDPPFAFQELESVTARGVRFGITTSKDDTTNPPAMQRWFHREVPGSELVHVPDGWGHLHLLPPENILSAFRYLRTGIW